MASVEWLAGPIISLAWYGAVMVSKRLDEMIHGRAQRTYLKGIDGYWADLVLSEFAFLEERGGTLEDVTFHQSGDGIRYVGAWGMVSLEFEPRSNWMGGGARLSGEGGTFEGELDLLVRERMPGTSLPPRLPLDRRTSPRTSPVGRGSARLARPPLTRPGGRPRRGLSANTGGWCGVVQSPPATGPAAAPDDVWPCETS